METSNSRVSSGAQTKVRWKSGRASWPCVELSEQLEHRARDGVEVVRRDARRRDGVRRNPHLLEQMRQGGTARPLGQRAHPLIRRVGLGETKELRNMGRWPRVSCVPRLFLAP